MNCENHPSWPAKAHATPWTGDKPQAICWLCVSNIMEYPHTKDIWLWKIGEKVKWLSKGTKEEKL